LNSLEDTKTTGPKYEVDFFVGT